MSTPTMAEAEAAVEQVKAALVRDVRVLVQWQQIDDLPDGSAAVLKARIAEVTAAWLAEQPQVVRPAFDVKISCRQSADVPGLTMTLPVIWSEQQ